MRKKIFIFLFILLSLLTLSSFKVNAAENSTRNLKDLFWRRAWPEMEKTFSSIKNKTPNDYALMANAYRFQNKWPQVVNILEAQRKNFPATVRPYADMILLLAYENTNNNKALELANSLFKSAPVDLKYYVAMAQYRLYDARKDSNNALASLNRMLANAGTDERKIFTLGKLIGLKNNPNAAAHALQLLDLQPGDKDAAAILERVKKKNNNIYTALGVYYHSAGNNQKGLEYLKNAKGRKANYYRAWCHSRLKENDMALNMWGSLAISGNAYASGAVTRISNLAKDKGMFNKSVAVLERISKERRGNIQARALQALVNLKGSSNPKERDRLEAKILKSFPNTNFSFKVLWDRAWRNLSTGNFEEAVKLFRQCDAPGVTFYRRARILYWLANAQSLAGDYKAADKTLNTLKNKYPLTIYGLLINPNPVIKNGVNPNLNIKPTELENWGFVNHAYLKLSRPKASAKELYRALMLSRWLGLEESYSEARRLETLMTSSPTLYRSDLEALYPRPFKNIVDAASKQYGVEANFVWAIMRQESAFQVNARSWVGAAGLMQLMPATAKGEAKRAGLSKYNLYSASDNIKLGTSHLAWLSSNFARPEYVMAAYNAGSGNANKWLKTIDENADLPHWIEAVKFTETNGYVQRVSANLMIYRLLYNAK
ncbi:MAG: transglycosylase SLT domain-containing protein [Synergistaceae bacterium]|nr:transglycosylase SLT domain-containing protein [Synergistaceae bacterium]